MKKQPLVFLIVSCFIFLNAKGVQALILPQVTMEEMIVKADTIVSGKSDHFHIHPDLEGNVLYAIITFKVEEYLKNNLQKEEIILMQVAREKGPDGKLVAGPLALKIDEEVVLFLTEEDNQGFRHVLGLSQGKYTVSQDRKGERQLLQYLKDVRFFDKATGEISDPKEIQVKLTYEEFKAIVRLATSRIKARKELFTVLPENHSF